jgi:hypothetical protein
MIRLEVLMLTGRRQGWIMIEYRCRVPSSSAKSANLKVTGFSKISEIGIGEEDRIVQALIENSKPA